MQVEDGLMLHFTFYPSICFSIEHANHDSENEISDAEEGSVSDRSQGELLFCFALFSYCGIAIWWKLFSKILEYFKNSFGIFIWEVWKKFLQVGRSCDCKEVCLLDWGMTTIDGNKAW